MILVKVIVVCIEVLVWDIWIEFNDIDKLVVVGLLCGLFVFIVDLVCELDLLVEVDFLEVLFYGDEMILS